MPSHPELGFRKINKPIFSRIKSDKNLVIAVVYSDGFIPLRTTKSTAWS
jgi:hypothetical protein